MKPKNNFFQKHSFRLAWFVLMTFSGITTIKSQNLLTESFNYASGTTLTSSSWIQQVAGGTPNVTVSAGNLTYPGTIANNFGNKISLTNTGQDVFRYFTATSLNTTTPAIYASTVVNVSAAQAIGDIFFGLGSTTYSNSYYYSTSVARLYIRSNGSGFSFGVMRSSGTVEYESTVRPFNTNMKVVLKYEQVAGTVNDIVKLYVDPASGSEPATADISHTGTATDATSFSSVELYQGNVANAPTLEMDGINVGTTWASVNSAVYDYGDTPTSYDFTKDGVYAPAVHTPVSGLLLGSILPDLELAPSSVAAGADNNGTNGDGTDEDAIAVSANQIRKGVPYTLSVPVTNPSGTKYLYGWIDFNNDGKFQLEEAATVVSFNTAGSSTQTLNWTGVQTGTLAMGATKLYMRLRLSDRSLADFLTAASGGALIDERSIGNGATTASNAADYATVANGEVEDYQIEVVNTFDYGDLPATFENDINGTALPALHAPLSGFNTGTLLDLESAPSSVVVGADNNGTNGDGADEDGITALTSVTPGVIYNVTVPVNIPSTLTGTKYLYGWLDLNGDGRFQAGELASSIATTTAITATNMTLTWNAAQTTTIAPGTTKIYLRLRLSNLNLLDFSSGTHSGLIDERSVGNGATAANNAANALTTPFGEVEDYQLEVGLYDMGDVPISYDTSKDGVVLPAAHMSLAGFMLGSIAPDLEQVPYSVAVGADNNGTNGDGSDEDAINTSANKIKIGVPYVLSVPVTNPSGSTKYLYGWIDFNNNGKFEAGEFATASTSAVGSSTLTLTWTAVQTATITVDKLYMRLRLSNRALLDFTSGTGATDMDERSIGNGAAAAGNPSNHATPVNGEVEDYQIELDNTFDYGDVPSTFEIDKDGNPLPALHASISGFTIGKLIDQEEAPSSVATGADNNGTNGDGVDEDGLTTLTSVSPGVAYSIDVPVNIPSTLAGSKYLYGWLDLNGDGRFQVGEVATGSVTGVGEQLSTLTWSQAQTSTIASGTTKIYLRLRLSNLNLLDFSSGTNSGLIDERSVGNGAIAANNAANALTTSFGEVEDYQLPVGLYDFGDAPVSYDTNNATAFVPARHRANPLYTIGTIVDAEQAAQNVAPGTDNNGANGDGQDEDGTGVATITRGAPFSFFTNINAPAASNAIAWIDFNNDGKFQTSEAAYATSTATTNGYQTTSTGASTVNFWFRGAQTSLIPAGVNNLYVRVRLSQTAGADNTGTADIDERSIGDGASTGVYTLPSFGEVEDYRFTVGNNIYDFGDAPISYEMDKDGTVDPVNFKPARNFSSQNLYLGTTWDHESGPASVTNPNDNNNPNGDGSDEDGITGPLYINPGAINTYTLGVKNYTGANATLMVWIDFNNNGRFEAGERQTLSVPVGGYAQPISFTAAQTALVSTSTNKVYMRARLMQAEGGVTLGDLTTGTNSGVVDEYAIGDGLSSGVYGYVALGEVEDYQLQVVRDFGDVPASYENGSPAFHSNGAEPDLYMGVDVDYEFAPQSVAAGADNNGTNGDGADEDAFSSPLTITSGSQFTMSVPVTTKTTGTKYLYGWIDFNGDGVFNGNEAATTSGSIVAGTAGQLRLTWTNTNASPAVLAAGKVYVRLRLSSASLGTFANSPATDTRSYGGSTALGEVEDYRFNIVSGIYDYGDAPAIYSRNQVGSNVEPRQSQSDVLRLGLTVDTEFAANTVAEGADNNGTNGDGTDEDGITTVMPVYKGTAYYSDVEVFNNSGSAKNLYGWIDFDNDGYFELSEVATVSVPSSAVQQKVQLTWNNTTTATIPVGATNVYMRLRISEGTLANNANALLDERSIGDGLTTGVYGTAFGGEVEDYRLPVAITYDYGDAIDSYDTSRNGVIAPARQAVSSALYIGNAAPDSEGSKQTSATAIGDDNNGTDDEDGVEISPMYAGGGYAYSVRVKAYNNTAGPKTLYGWIDFNNDGRFQVGEATNVSVPIAATQGYVTLNWTAGQNVIAGNPDNLKLRLRLSEGTLTDYTTAPLGDLVDERALADGLNTGEYHATTPVIYNGEVEDHIIPMTTQLDYGDVPLYFEDNFIGTSVPARHRQVEDLIIGATIDLENGAQSVTGGSDNTGTNGDGLDEDGIDNTVPLPTLYSGAEYAALINIRNNLATAATLHAWIDLDGNGRFTSNEYTSTAIPANAGDYVGKLTWAAPTYTSTANYTYMRVRLTNAVLTDNTSTDNVDERSIGDGLTTGAYGTIPQNGEVEDYYLPAVPNDNTTIDCTNDDDRLGVLDPLQALFHGTIVKLRNSEFLVFGNSAAANGTDQMNPIKVTPTNGYNYAGVPLLLTGASNAWNHQYMLLSSAGLYVWGQGNVNATPGSPIVFPGGTGFHQVALPTGVGPANIQFMDAGSSSSYLGSLMLLTKTGEIWVYSNTVGSDVQGDGNTVATGWHQVMTDAGTPLTGMKDVRSAGGSAIATNGNEFYTWGRNVFLGDGQNQSNKSYATKMTTPTGISLPVKQQDIANANTPSTSYFLRDSAGKVFVLGNNASGELGLGNTNDSRIWRTINFMNEEPNAAGNQTDVTKAIRPVKWISASNHDNTYGTLFSVITDEKRIYSTGSNSGSRSGVVNPTSTQILTAVTIGNGTAMLPGEMTYVEAGGHISIAVQAGSDRFGYVGHTIDGSDGCGGCTGTPTEYNFTKTPAIGQVCGNKLLDYGDLDDRYNLGDKASHEISYIPEDNKLFLGIVPPDAENGPQFTVTGSGNDAFGDDTTGFPDDEDALNATHYIPAQPAQPAIPDNPATPDIDESRPEIPAQPERLEAFLPVKTAGSTYTLSIPLTNNTGSTAYLYGFIDWNYNGIFEPGEAIEVPVPSSAAQQTIDLTWPDNSAICGTEVVRSFVRLRLTTEQFVDDTTTAADERSFLAAPDGEVEDYYVDWTPAACQNFCYKPGATTGGDTLDTKVGVTSLSRAGMDDSDNWPMVRKGAWIALESKTKGFVVNRVAFSDADNDPATMDVPTGIPSENFVEGMMVYDTTNKCLKMYTIKDGDTVPAWHCISTQACPD
ncbi:GEVED domain-containing protein [Epilithonimonas caeni]|uniref:GEVED domain-containing protein n=1 Tax=Epilithonimonas caeni TaxID=365343 RepID=UPI000403B82E|nr:GEVED domain-containing protein [Epilithonimonas caeni]